MICYDYASFRNVFMAGEPVALDGLPTWEPSKFDGTLIFYEGWTISFPLNLQMTGSDDAVTGVDEYHWYLSQPTALTTPRLSISRNDPLGSTRSGRVSLGLTAAGAALLASDELGPPYSAAAMDSFLRGCYVYSYTIATNKYYVGDLWRLAFAPRSLDI